MLPSHCVFSAVSSDKAIWKPMRPESNVSSETGKRNFEHSLIGLPPTVAKSINGTHRGRSRQRARLSGTTSQAPRHCRHRPEPALGRTKSPKGSPEWILEAQRLISVGDAILGIDSFCLGLRYTAAPPAQLPSVFSHRLQESSDQADRRRCRLRRLPFVTRVGSVMPLVHGMRRWQHPRWNELRKRRSTW